MMDRCKFDHRQSFTFEGKRKSFLLRLGRSIVQLTTTTTTTVIFQGLELEKEKSGQVPIYLVLDKFLEISNVFDEIYSTPG
ncbi:hypothetical protein DERF_013801 [Dermatophagoides farinae]|uniref:Uncharacterized protein n=1 Tax=Dermatophagoides farinae TaxID=6954 RepID=A0A922HQY6_DERFA|nr:hypothetical protein DERF_013801 [Dermatophagoides farinae]